MGSHAIQNGRKWKGLYLKIMVKREYYDLKENFSIMHHIAKMVDNVSEILEMYPNIEDMPLKDVKEYLMDRYSKFDEDTFNKFNELMTKNADSNDRQDEFLKMFNELKNK